MMAPTKLSPEQKRYFYSIPFDSTQEKNEVIEQLLQLQSSPCISMYMPSEEAGTETRQNPIRFKNLCRQVDEQLTLLGWDEKQRKQSMEPLVELQDDFHFWQHQTPGLALFLTPKSLFVFHLPRKVKSFFSVSQHPHVLQMLPLLKNKTFYVLVLHQQNPRLFRADAFQLYPIRLPASVRSIESLNEEVEPQLQFRSVQGPNHSPSSIAHFHGQGATNSEWRKDQILRYFRKLDAAVQEKIGSEQEPLVLSGVSYLHALYREASTYSSLHPESLHGDPSSWAPSLLHCRAFETLYHQEKDASPTVTDILESKNGKAALRLRDVVPAAHYGQVEQLFVARDKHSWGTFAPQDNAMNVEQVATPHNEDLLNLAALQTLQHGGNVHIVTHQQLPSSSYCAAVLRY